MTGWKCTSSLQSLVVSILARDNVPNCKINFIDEVTDQRSSICSHNPFPPSGDEAGEPAIVIQSSWKNERRNHLVQENEPNLLKYPLEFKTAFEKLAASKLHV